MQRSVLTKLVTIYLIIALLLIGVLGVTLISTYRNELINQRIRELQDRAETVSSMLNDTLIVPKEIMKINILQNIAAEYDAIIQVADIDGKIMMQVDDLHQNVYDTTINIEDDLLSKCLSGQTYLRKSYYNLEFGERMTTVAIPLYQNALSNKVIGVVIIHSSDRVIQESFQRVLKGLWIPSLAIIMLGIVMIFLLNYRITMPLLQMNYAAKEIAKGNFEKRVYVKSKDEVGQLAESFNKMAMELSVTDNVRKDFIANISHELRSPLTSITGFVQGMLDGVIPQSEYDKYLKIVLSEAQRLTRLTREMLELSQIESGRFPIHKTVYDQNELIRRVIITKTQVLEEKSIDLHIDFCEQKANVNADMGGIEQVITNLLDNAIKFTPQGGSIFIKTVVKDNKLLTVIKDTGHGIRQEDLPHIWERFFTENKARSGSGGMGLGLSIVKKIMLQHQEDIWVESAYGAGAEFTFTLELANKK